MFVVLFVKGSVFLMLVGVVLWSCNFFIDFGVNLLLFRIFGKDIFIGLFIEDG